MGILKYEDAGSCDGRGPRGDSSGVKDAGTRWDDGGRVCTCMELHTWLMKGERVLVVDVRSVMLFEVERITGAVSMPHALGSNVEGMEEWVEKEVKRRRVRLEVVVFYDQASQNYGVYSPGVEVCRVIESMRVVDDVRLVEGGFLAYADQFPEDVTYGVAEEMSKTTRRNLKKK